VTRDEISLTIPREEGFQDVAQLVLGGVAARLNLTYESLDDLAVALESLLERADAAGHVTVELHVEDEAIRAAVGPFRDGTLAELKGETTSGLGLRRVLQTVVDSFELDGRDDGDWVVLVKSVRFNEAGDGR
jgi:anti-sigma regulatory factor (Ser/Thr protein kinase)